MRGGAKRVDRECIFPVHLSLRGGQLGWQYFSFVFSYVFSYVHILFPFVRRSIGGKEIGELY